MWRTFNDEDTRYPPLAQSAVTSRVNAPADGRDIATWLLSIPGAEKFSHHGDEIAWGTIGNASCAEGMFWESLNAAGVLGIPMIVSIWDDGYGISVPNDFQITKGNLSELLKGFQREPKSKQGFDIYAVKGWDYAALCET